MLGIQRFAKFSAKQSYLYPHMGKCFESRDWKHVPQFLCEHAMSSLLLDVEPLTYFPGYNTCSTDLGKRTSALFVEDDHALLKPSTLGLTIKTLGEVWHLGSNMTTAAASNSAVVQQEGAVIQESVARKNVEVKVRASSADGLLLL